MLLVYALSLVFGVNSPCSLNGSLFYINFLVFTVVVVPSFKAKIFTGSIGIFGFAVSAVF